MTVSHPSVPDLEALVRLFHDSIAECGSFSETTANAMPRAYRSLLAHENHMTVTVEAFHNSPVDVVVLGKRVTETHYARKILLTRRSDGRVVQYGIMRVALSHLPETVRQEIESETIPLGRVLIEHNVLRQVELVSLWRIAVHGELADRLEMSEGETTYGRTALIHVGGEPAVELLEIVTPID